MNKNPPLGYAYYIYFLYNPAMEARTWLTHLFLLWPFPAKWPFFFLSAHLSVYYIIILQYHLEVPNGIRAVHSWCSMQLSSGRKSVQPKGIREKEIITVPISQITYRTLLYELCIQ